MNFENDDKLNRKRYADFLLEIVNNYNVYKRDSENLSFSIAIDSSWGTGKTTFLEMFEDKIKSDNEKTIVIKYSAWKNDFWDNPFETLMCTILSNDIFVNNNDIENIKTLGKDLKEVGINLGKSLIKKQLNKFFDEEIVDEIDKRVINSGHWNRFKKSKSANYDFFAKYNEYSKNLEKMKKILNEICKDRKIIILIDELDRCKPIFAINMLELVKHIFDIENMVFIFALDIQQLSHSIKTIYGDMDSPGYLCRFFDYISKLPKCDTDLYIDYLIGNNPLINGDLKEERIKSNKYVKFDFIENFKSFSRVYNLSLRDINIIYSNFLLLEMWELKENTNMRCYTIYLFLLIMKYKDYECFNNIFINSKESAKIYEEDFILKFEKVSRDKNLEIRDILSNIVKDVELSQKIDFEEIGLDGIAANNNFKIQGVIIENKKIVAQFGDSSFAIQKAYDHSVNYSNILFYSDIENWESIKNLRLKEFLHRKLEFFDFSNQNENTI